MPVLLIASIVSPLIPIFIGIRKKKYVLLWVYSITGFSFDILITLLKRYFHVSYQWPTNIFMLLEFLIISFIYRDRIFKNYRAFFQLFILALSLYFVFRTISKSVYVFNMYDSCFFSLSYMVYSITGFNAILKERQVVYLEKSWFFWLNIAFVVYASGVFFLFLFKEDLKKADLQLYLLLWNNIFCLLNVFKYCIIAVALYHYNETNKREPD